MDKARIEKEAWRLQFEIYSQRRMLWPNTEPPVLAMFEPRVIAEYLGFEYEIRDRLGAIDSRTSEAAGTIDLRRQIIAVSAQFSSEERRFTGAHEIAHAVMHPWIGERVAHRDRPMFDLGPDGHFKFPHLWPLKLPRAGRPNYELSAVLSAMREAASLRR